MLEKGPSLPAPPLQLPVQAAPPCLAYVFLQESHGRVVKEMLAVVEQVAQGAASQEDSLKEILGMLQSWSHNSS